MRTFMAGFGKELGQRPWRLLLFGKVFGKSLNDDHIKDLLSGKRIFLKNLKNREGKTYDVYLTPDGIEDYTYELNGKERAGSRFTFKIEFPKKKTEGGVNG